MTHNERSPAPRQHQPGVDPSYLELRLRAHICNTECAREENVPVRIQAIEGDDNKR